MSRNKYYEPYTSDSLIEAALKGSPRVSPERAEFDALFEKLTGVHPDNSYVSDGFIFFPFEIEIKMKRIPTSNELHLAGLAGHEGWKDHIVPYGDEYLCEGWWFRRPE